MPSVKRAKTTFTAGELAPELLGRGDVAAWGNGAAKLRNVFIQPTGGLQRRPGLRHLDVLPGAARLVPYEASTELTFLLVLLAGRVRILRNDTLVTELSGPWTAAMLPQINYTQNANMLLLVHPSMPPQVVRRSDAGAWSVAPFAFAAEPFFRYVPAEVSVTPSGTTGSVSVTATSPVFVAAHAGAQLRIQGRRVRVTAVSTPSTVMADVVDPLVSTDATTDWAESAFSGAPWLARQRLLLPGAAGARRRAGPAQPSLVLAQRGLRELRPGKRAGRPGDRLLARVGPAERHPRRSSPGGISRSSPRARNGWCRATR